MGHRNGDDDNAQKWSVGAKRACVSAESYGCLLGRREVVDLFPIYNRACTRPFHMDLQRPTRQKACSECARQLNVRILQNRTNACSKCARQLNVYEQPPAANAQGNFKKRIRTNACSECARQLNVRILQNNKSSINLLYYILNMNINHILYIFELWIIKLSII